PGHPHDRLRIRPAPFHRAGEPGGPPVRPLQAVPDRAADGGGPKGRRPQGERRAVRQPRIEDGKGRPGALVCFCGPPSPWHVLWAASPCCPLLPASTVPPRQSGRHGWRLWGAPAVLSPLSPLSPWERAGVRAPWPPDFPSPTPPPSKPPP